MAKTSCSRLAAAADSFGSSPQIACWLRKLAGCVLDPARPIIWHVHPDAALDEDYRPLSAAAVDSLWALLRLADTNVGAGIGELPPGPSKPSLPRPTKTAAPLPLLLTPMGVISAFAS